MAREDGWKNLRPYDHERAVENGRKGGQKFSENQKRRASLKEAFQVLLSMPVVEEDIKQELAKAGIEDEYRTNDIAIALSMIQKALEGNVNAATFVRDTFGEKPTDKVKADLEVDTQTQVVILPDNNRDGN